MQFIQWAFLGNVYLFMHMFGGALGMKIFMRYVRADTAFLIVVLITLVWEVGELVYQYIIEFDSYESPEHFLADAFGDIFGAVLMAFIIWI
jgi:hypothetical protein